MTDKKGYFVNRTHRTIKANNVDYILDEGMAIQLFQAMQAEFNWAGTVFCEGDVAETIANHRDVDGLEPLSEEDMRSATARVLESYGWGWLTEYAAEWGAGEVRSLTRTVKEKRNE